MKSFVVLAPILDGKVDVWKANADANHGNEKVKAIMRDAGATRVRGWSAKTPDGKDVAIVLHEGPDLSPETFMAKVFGSNDPDVQAMMKKNEEVHGPMDPSAPPPLGALAFDFKAD